MIGAALVYAGWFGYPSATCFWPIGKAETVRNVVPESFIFTFTK